MKEKKLLCEEVKEKKINNIIVKNQYGKQYVWYGIQSIDITIEEDTITIKVVE